MTLIRNIECFASNRVQHKSVILMCGFGGSIWQVRRLVRVLNSAGYDVMALDFSKTVLSQGDPTLLPTLVDEVVQYCEKSARATEGETLLVGVSLGSLLALNVLRRSSLFRTGVLITGGDIAKIAKVLYPAKWPQSYSELAWLWQRINMYSDPAELADKRLLFVVHPSRKLIDVKDIYHEVQRQQEAGNDLLLVKRLGFDHIGTIIMETVVFPRRILSYIKQISR